MRRRGTVRELRATSIDKRKLEDEGDEGTAWYERICWGTCVEYFWEKKSLNDMVLIVMIVSKIGCSR